MFRLCRGGSLSLFLVCHILKDFFDGLLLGRLFTFLCAGGGFPYPVADVPQLLQILLYLGQRCFQGCNFFQKRFLLLLQLLLGTVLIVRVLGTGETQTTGYGTLTGTCHFQLENVRCFSYFQGGIDLNVFEAVKQSVTTRQAAEYYGIHVGRNGMACCPFHNDKTPSMKLDRRYHCFGCGADGDVIDFAAALYGLGKKEAAVQLAQDFGLSYEDWKPPGKAKKPKPRQKSPEEQFQEAKSRCFRTLADYLHLLMAWRTDYAPHSPEEAFHPRFVEALQKQDQVEYLLDVLLFGETEEKAALITDYGKDVIQLEKRMAELAAANAARTKKHHERHAAAPEH